MTDEIPMTVARLDLLRKVRDGQVDYAISAGRYRLRGDQVYGWAGRTLAALRRAGYITISHETPTSLVSTVELTDRGKSAVSG